MKRTHNLAPTNHEDLRVKDRCSYLWRIHSNSYTTNSMNAGISRRKMNKIFPNWFVFIWTAPGNACSIQARLLTAHVFWFWPKEIWNFQGKIRIEFSFTYPDSGRHNALSSYAARTAERENRKLFPFNSSMRKIENILLCCWRLHLFYSTEANKRTHQPIVFRANSTRMNIWKMPEANARLPPVIRSESNVKR